MPIPNVEKITADYLRSVTDARIVAKTPDDTSTSWVRLQMLAAPDETDVEHLIQFMVQLDCYAGKDVKGETHGQPEAWELATTIREQLKAMRHTRLADTDDNLIAVCTQVKFVGMTRAPDADFKPARERFILTALIWMHP